MEPLPHKRPHGIFSTAPGRPPAGTGTSLFILLHHGSSRLTETSAWLPGISNVTGQSTDIVQNDSLSLDTTTDSTSGESSREYPDERHEFPDIRPMSLQSYRWACRSGTTRIVIVSNKSYLSPDPSVRDCSQLRTLQFPPRAKTSTAPRRPTGVTIPDFWQPITSHSSSKPVDPRTAREYQLQPGSQSLNIRHRFRPCRARE